MTTDTVHRFGAFGGRYVPETLIPALDELDTAFDDAMRDRRFGAELNRLLKEYVGRPSPLSSAPRFSEEVGCAVYLKREDLLHTGAHKINNALGQALLAERMGKRRIIAETGAGQHGVAAATACALLGLECGVYMGTEDMRRQQPNVQRMELLGATVAPVEAGGRPPQGAGCGASRRRGADNRGTPTPIRPTPPPRPPASTTRARGRSTRRCATRAAPPTLP